VAETYFEIGQLYLEAGLEEEAKKHFNQATKLYKKLGLHMNEFIKTKMDSVGLNVN
jgi:hypothetical protein